MDKFQKELIEIEKIYNIIVLFWCIHGSRGCGREQRNSDYDIGFIYLDKSDRYKYIHNKEFGDLIGVNLKHLMDMQKKHTMEFNRYKKYVNWDSDFDEKIPSLDYRTIYHWMKSPYIFHSTDFLRKNKRYIEKYFYAKDVLNYYIPRIKGNLSEFLYVEYPLIKRYLRAIHSILSAEWIIKNATAPPMHFKDLLLISNEREICNKVQLLRYLNYWGLKEHYKRDDNLNQYIEKKIENIITKSKYMPMADTFDWDAFDKIYFRTLSKYT